MVIPTPVGEWVWNLQMRKIFDFFSNTRTIIFALSVSQTIGLGYASIQNNANWALFARGALLGYALSFGLSKAAVEVPRIPAKRRRAIGYVAGVALLIVSPIIIAPAIGSIPLAIAPDLVAVVVAVCSGSLFPAEQKPAEQSQTQAGAKSRKRGARAAPSIACKYGCGRSGTTNAMNAHYKGCPKNPARQFIEAVNK